MNKRKNRETDERLISFGIGDDSSSSSSMLESLKNETIDTSLEDFKQLLDLTYNVTKECEKRRPINNCKDNPNCFHHLGGLKLLGCGEDDIDLFGEKTEEEEKTYVQTSILKLPKVDVIRHTKRPTLNTPCGIRNLGATCYMNSVIQTLFMNSQFKSHLFNIVNIQNQQVKDFEKDVKDEKDCNNNNGDNSNNNNNNSNDISNNNDLTSTTSTTEIVPINDEDNSATSTVNNSPSNCTVVKDLKDCDMIEIKSSPFQKDVVFQLAYLFYQLQSSQKSTIDPTPLVNCLQLPSDLQQDTQEFYNLFIGLLESKFKDDIISKLFKGSYDYVTECLYCKKRSLNNSSFFEITLKTNGCKNFNESFTDYLAKEKLIGQNQITCNECQTKRDCQRSIEFKKFPTHLNIQLMRYEFDKDTFQKKKLHGNYTFPLEIDLSQYFNNNNNKEKSSTAMDLDHEYELTAIMMHKGLSISSGHYITHVKNDLTGEWWEFDDEDVKKLSVEKIGKDSLGEKRKPKEIREGLVSSTSSYSIIYSKKNRDKVAIPKIENSHLKQLFEDNEKRFDQVSTRFTGIIDDATKIFNQRKEDINAIHNKLEVQEGEKYYWIDTDWLSDWIKGQSVAPIDNSKLLCQHGQLAPNKVETMKRISQVTWDFLYAAHQGGPVLDQDAHCQKCLYQIISGKKDHHNAESSKDQIIKSENQEKNRQEGYYISKHWYKEWSKKVVKQIVKDSTPVEDIICDHGGLSIVKEDMMIVKTETWSFIQTHFAPKAESIASSTTPCQTCLKLDKESTDQTNSIKKERSKLKTLITLIKSQKYNFNLKNGSFYFVPKEWINRWYKFIYSDKSKDENDVTPPGSLSFDSLICPHNGLVYDFEIGNFVNTFDLKDMSVPFLVVPQTIYNLILEAYQVLTVSIHLDDGELSFEPCQQCHIAKNQQLEFDKTNFKDQSIYIHIISSDDNEKDSKYYIFPTKTRRLYKRIQIWPVNHDYTVGNLKLLICTETEIPTFQQKLYINEGVMMKDAKTLDQYKVVPDQIIVLKEYQELDGFFDDGVSEAGFKGTILNQ
ncbi:ubiquitin-specific protease 48-like protein [Cavenderia fasciculata]|uniref:Ubiquitin-specific protease 48-like protein n=1 Tax=Cavenderia fasciculata TaxID=261658 RepID=F4Q573_CACFS|nr:ubiquitin-specific protease 48-like protein [Cavenderia fasciculata]EGG17132.1 ubiquitin-specific protease 48-like protein [Cavenderia fasciculata]|eukprot:XP_004355616.1 ubiquitin-specific protease 48-like protein [Cavenderia fasciculata]